MKPTRRNLAAQFESGLASDSVADLVDDGLHVGGRRPVSGLDEVGVLVGDERATDPKPRRPTRSISSPADSSPGIGLTKTEPAFCPPGWFSRRQRTISAISRSDARRHPSTDADSASRRSRGRRDPSRGSAARATRPGASCDCRSREVEDLGTYEAGGDVGTVTTGVHPHRAADRAGHADGPFEAQSDRPQRSCGPAPAERRPNRRTPRRR